MNPIHNLGDAPPPPPPPERSPSSMSGRTLLLSRDSRPTLTRTFSGSQGHDPRQKLTRIRSLSWDESSRPRMARTLSPRVGSKRKMLSPPPSQSLPIHSRSEEEKEEESNREKDEEEGMDQSQRSVHFDSRPSFRSQSESSVMTSDDDDDDTFTGTMVPDPTLSLRESDHEWYLCGYRLPFCCKKPNTTQVSTFVVRYAPCFVCKKKPAETLTVRNILLRLIVLDFIFGGIQVAAAIWLAIVLRSRKIINRYGPDILSPNVWSINGSVFFAGFLGLCVCVVMVFTRRIVKEVSVPGALKILWCMLWIIPLEIFAIVWMFDIHGISEVWITHWWGTFSMTWFRSRFCFTGTYNDQCIVPIKGLPDYTNETAWCEAYYNSNSCKRIKDDGQAEMAALCDSFYNINAGLGVGLIALLILTKRMIEGIITRPMVQANRESNIPCWLLLPSVGCLTIGCIYLLSPSSILQGNLRQYAWIAVVYIISGGLYVTAAFLGWIISGFSILNTRDKRHKSCLIIIFILMMILTLVSVGTIFGASVVQSVQVVSVPISNQDRGNLACSIASGTCSFCDSDSGERKCPEWTRDDLIIVLRGTLKQSATLAAIFMIYSFGATRFGIALYRHNHLYQIDYV